MILGDVETGNSSTLERLVIFAILMENDEGILEKSPEYIEEKFNNAMNVPYPLEMLDMMNKAKFKRWRDKWVAPLESFPKERNTPLHFQWKTAKQENRPKCALDY